MVHRVNTQNDGERDKRTQHDGAAINYYSETPSSPRPNLKSSKRFDELMVSLANSHENRRARQVMDWERMGRQYFPLSV